MATQSDTTTDTTGASSSSSKFPKSATLTDEPTGTAEKRWPNFYTYAMQYAATLGRRGTNVITGKLTRISNVRPIRPDFAEELCPNGNGYFDNIDPAHDWESPDFDFPKWSQPDSPEGGLHHWGRMKQYYAVDEKIIVINSKLATVLIKNVAEDVRELLRREGTDLTIGRDIFARLEIEYGGSDDVTRRIDTKCFLQIKVGPGESLKAFLARAAKLVREINSSGTPEEQKEIKALLGRQDELIDTALARIEDLRTTEVGVHTAAGMNTFWIDTLDVFVNLFERCRSLQRLLHVKAGDLTFITSTTEWHTMVAALTDKISKNPAWKDAFSATLDSHVSKHSPFKDISRALTDVVKLKGNPSSSSRSNRTGTDAGSFVGEGSYTPGSEICPIHGGHKAQKCRIIQEELARNPGASLSQIKTAARKSRREGRGPCKHCGNRRCFRGDTCFSRKGHDAENPDHRLHEFWLKHHEGKACANLATGGNATKVILGAFKSLNQRLSSLEGGNSSMAVTPPQVQVPPSSKKKGTGLFAGTALADEVWMVQGDGSSEEDPDHVEPAGHLSDGDSSSTDSLEWGLSGDPQSREISFAYDRERSAWVDTGLIYDYPVTQPLEREGNATIVEGNATLVEGNATLVEDNATLVKDNATLVEDNATLVEGNATLVEGDERIIERHQDFQ